MENTKERILAAAMAGVRQYGLDGVTMKNIAALSGMAVGVAYSYFASKDELMEACFYEVDRKLAQQLQRPAPPLPVIAQDPMKAVRGFWSPYFRYLIDHPDETVFYHRFRDGPNFHAFDQKRDASYFKEFYHTVPAMLDAMPGLRDLPTGLLWLHVLTSTVMYAKYVIEGVLEDTPATEDQIFRLLTTGLTGFLFPEHS